MDPRDGEVICRKCGAKLCRLDHNCWRCGAGADRLQAVSPELSMLLDVREQPLPSPMPAWNIIGCLPLRKCAQQIKRRDLRARLLREKSDA